ncbi:Transposable element P transposase [Labeo rohita]|uniref:Transposable element P transposase n=1 Tax=Labeo rohita TaxID=84645 RepID=A0ABQ8L8Z1_LABRO|nr:Transposable element P transposase [Labeo rohita]
MSTLDASGKQSHVPPSEKDSVAGSSSQEQVNEEAVAGSSSMRERHIEDVVYSSVRQCHRTAAAECSLTLKIRALKSQVSKLRAKVKHLQRQKVSKGKKELTKKELMMKELQHLLPAKVYAFVFTQLQMSQRKCQGYRWTTQDKAFFLSLWHASPKCYRLLCKVFSMPSVRTLQKTCQAVDFKTGFNTNILSTMRKAMETTKPIDKLCAIVTDEMSLKEAVHYNEAADRVEGFEDYGKGQRTPYVANYASGFMSMLFDGIRELWEAGMECLVFICDQAAGNRAMLTRLGVTKEQPFFSVDGIRVFCLWDPPHLIKNIRNNWRRHGFVLDGNEITWDILEDLYACDSH